METEEDMAEVTWTKPEELKLPMQIPGTGTPTPPAETPHPGALSPVPAQPEEGSVGPQLSETPPPRGTRTALDLAPQRPPPLRAMQILIGLTQLVFGVPLSVSMVRTVAGKSGASFWTGIWFIISGAVTVELRRRPTRWNMRLGLLMNGISVAATCVGVTIYSVSLLFTPAPETLYFSATTLTLTVALLLFTLLEMGLATVSALYCYRSLFQFETTYSILHDVIMRHPSRSE